MYLVYRNGWENTTYGKIIIPSISKLKYKWYLKINKSDDGHIIIGISSNTKNKKKRFYYDKTGNDYSYWAWKGEILDSKKVYLWKKYGIKCRTNDTIDMELDMNKKQLIYYINGIYQGIAFKDIKYGNNINYRFVITLYYKDSTVSIIKCTITS